VRTSIGSVTSVLIENGCGILVGTTYYGLIACHRSYFTYSPLMASKVEVPYSDVRKEKKKEGGTR
jgi:hypothetical protein